MPHLQDFSLLQNSKGYLHLVLDIFMYKLFSGDYRADSWSRTYTLNDLPTQTNAHFALGADLSSEPAVQQVLLNLTTDSHDSGCTAA